MLTDWLYKDSPIACDMYGDILLVYAQNLEDHWSKDLELRDVIKFRLLLVYRRDCTVHIARNLSLCPMSSNFEEGIADGHMVCVSLDLLGTVAE